MSRESYNLIYEPATRKSRGSRSIEFESSNPTSTTQHTATHNSVGYVGDLDALPHGHDQQLVPPLESETTGGGVEEGRGGSTLDA